MYEPFQSDKEWKLLNRKSSVIPVVGAVTYTNLDLETALYVQEYEEWPVRGPY